MTRLLIVFGAIITLIWTFITWMSLGLPLGICKFFDVITFKLMSESIFDMHNGFFYDTPNNDMPTVVFLYLFALSFIIYSFLIWKIPHYKPHKNHVIVIIGLAILFRFILLFSVPVHENDIYRYLWDGKVFKSGINPYKFAPDDLFMYENDIQEDFYDPVREEVILWKDFSKEDKRELDRLIELRDRRPVSFNRIGHSQVATIYPPVVQSVFLLASIIKEDSIFVMKFIFMLFEIGIMILTIKLLTHFRQNPNFILIYAWSPLTLKEFPNSGHYDPVAIFFLVLGVYAFLKRNDLGNTLGLTLSTLSKFFAAILLPIFNRFLKWKHYVYFGLIMLIAYIPFFLWGKTGVSGVFSGFMTYNEQWSYNASIFEVVYYSLEAMNPKWVYSLYPAKVICGLILLAILCYLTLNKNRQPIVIVHKTFIAIASLFLINPVGDPWYYCWCLPFLCLFRYRAFILLSALLVMCYINFHTEIEWLKIDILRIDLMKWVIYVPFYGLLIYDICSQKYKLLFNKICKEQS